MQHRRSKKPWIFLSLVALLAAGFGFLVIKEVPAPQQHMEKSLDAAKFIQKKQ